MNARSPSGHLQPTWVPEAMAQWCAPGGPLHDVGTLADLCTTAPDPEAEAVSERLRRHGVQRGDVVAWQLPNSSGSVAAYRACWRLGAVAAPIHHLAGAAELDQMLKGLDPVAFLGSGDDVEFRDDRGNPGPINAKGESAVTAPVPSDTAPADIAVILHTSGSSGRPKAVMHTHRALAYKARSMAMVHGLGPSDAVLMPAPLAHVSGLLNGVLVPDAAGMRSVLMARWKPDDALDLIESERITFMVGPPTFFVGLEQAEGFSPERVDSLRLLSVGGAGVTAEFAERTSQVFGAEVKRSYGSTEAPTVTTSAAGADPWTMAHTEGRPTGGVRVRTVDPYSGRPTRAEAAGEIQVSGPELFCGYLDPDQTGAATVGDWFRTGDVGVLDADGRLTVTGRLGDVIIRGGENVDPLELEAHLVAHADVTAAVATGIADDRLGERVVAIVELVPGAPGFGVEECRAWFRRRGVARFKTPEEVIVVEELPVLASGKVDRSTARRLVVEP